MIGKALWDCCDQKIAGLGQRWRRRDGLCRRAVLPIRVAGPLFQIRSGGLHPPKAFEVVGDDREMDLESCLGKPDPSHAPESIAALPGAKNFLRARIVRNGRLCASSLSAGSP